GGSLRIFATEESLPDAVSESVWLHHPLLAGGPRRRAAHGRPAWRILRRLLLGFDDAAVRGRCDEPDVCCRAVDADPTAEGASRRPSGAARDRCRHGSGRSDLSGVPPVSRAEVRCFRADAVCYGRDRFTPERAG